METHVNTYMLSPANCQSYDRAGSLQGDMGLLQHTQVWHLETCHLQTARRRFEMMLSETMPCSSLVPFIAASLVLAAASLTLYIVSLKNNNIKTWQAPQPEHFSNVAYRFAGNVLAYACTECKVPASSACS